jgi:hypothetical protein
MSLFLAFFFFLQTTKQSGEAMVGSRFVIIYSLTFLYLKVWCGCFFFATLLIHFAAAQISTFPYQQDFENGAAGWTVSSPGWFPL